MLFTRVIGHVCGLKGLKVKKKKKKKEEGVIEDSDVTSGFQIKTERQMELCQHI
jgi:hypothetical protein